MYGKKLSKELRKKLTAEEIGLPESLSAENIEKLINEEGGIVSPRRRREKSKIIRIMASAAAAIIMIIGLTAVLGLTADKITVVRQESIITEKTQSSDYSEVENAVLSYFKDYYNNSKTSFKDGVYGIFNGFTMDKADRETANGTISAPKPESATSAAPGSTSATDFDSFTSDLTEEAEHSTTNLQVDGVDEGDIIKNDGRYIYYMTDHRIVISDCKDPENMEVVSFINVFDQGSTSYYAQDMYIHGDYLVVIINVYKNEQFTFGAMNSAVDCVYAPASDTIIRVYDISDRSNPEIAYAELVNGNYISSRIIGGKLLTVTQYSIPYRYYLDGDFETMCDGIKEAGVPEYSVNGGEMMKIPSDRINLLDKDNAESYVVTSLIDLKDLDAEPILDASLCGGWEIYCTSENLFLARNEYYGFARDREEEFEQATHIYKYDITDEGVSYKASATVGGTWHNQFSMDKYGDSFRIATTGYNRKKGRNESMVYILDGDMNVKGYLGGIAENEDIYAARFMGETLYLVTFYQTDPLFVIDLSDETNPVIKGELKIPGFSSYLHPVGDGLVIGVGTGGNDFGTDGSAKVSLFDVSDPTAPKEIDNYTVHDAYFDTNHKSFMVVDEDTVGLCITEYRYDSWYNYHATDSVMLIDFSKKGLEIGGRYEGIEGNYNALRGAFIGDSIFAVNGAGINSYSMANNEKLGELIFADARVAHITE